MGCHRRRSFAAATQTATVLVKRLLDKSTSKATECNRTLRTLLCSAPAVAADPVNAVTGVAHCTKPATGGELHLRSHMHRQPEQRSDDRCGLCWTLQCRAVLH